MIRVEKLSYGFPQKELYEDISFTLEAGQHCALIGSNGCGKSTLVDMIIDTERMRLVVSDMPVSLVSGTRFRM